MNPRCAAAIAQAALKLGKKVNKEYLRNIEAKVRETSAGIRMKDPAAWRAMDNETRMALVGTELAKEIQHQSARKATNAARDAVTHARNVDIVSAASSKGMTGNEGIQHIIGFIPDGKGGYINAESRAKALEQQHYIHLQPLIDLEKKGKLFGLLTDKEQMLDIVKEVRGERTGNADAKIVADAINKTNESVLTEYNSFGGDIRQLKNYLAQAQDQWRVYRAGKDKWVADAMQHIDRSTLMDSNGVPLSDAKAIEFLNEAWWNKASDGIGKDKVASGQFGGNQAIANRHRKHRVLHWKSADSWMYMQEHYGGGTLIDQISSHVKSMSEETVLMELFGSNPLHAIDLLKEVAEKSDKANGVNPAKTTAQANRLDKMVDSLAGINQGITGNIGVHKFFTGLRNLAVFDKLGGIITSQIADNGTAIATARVLNIPVSDWASMKARGYTDASVKRMANANAIGFQVHLDNLSRLSEGTDNTGITGKMAAFTMKYSMANMTTQNHRRSFAALVESHLGSLSREFDWNTLPAADKKLLEGKGFTQKDWAIMRSATPDAETGLLGLQQINEVSADTIRKLIPDEIANIHSTAADIIDRLSSQNTKDAERLQGRQTKFAEYKDKIQKMIDDYVSTREKRVEDYSSSNLKRGGEMMARLDQAEVELELAKASIDATNERRADKFAEEVKRGMETYGRRRSEIGETLGAKRHSAKLQAAGADSAYTKLSEQLIAKKNELFGHERVEDGLVVIGELTKAVKELDAYTAKMEKRIADSYKKDGGIKKGKEGTIDRAEKLKDDAKIEYEAIKQSVEGRMNALKEKVTGSQMEIRGIIDSIEAKKNRAEAEADIASYLATEKNADKVQGLLDTLEFRRDQTADRMMSEGERIGYKKAMAEAKVKAMAKREEAYTKTANKEVFSKATELEKRIDKRMNELEELTKSIDDKSTERNKLASEYEARIGKQEEKAIELARRDTALKITAMAIEEAEMAVLQPNLHSKSMLKLHKGEIVSEIGASFFQFKSFAVAMVNQHMMQRASMLDGKLSQAAYRLELLALTSVFGGMGLLMNDLISGKDPREVFDSEDPWVMAKFGKQAILKGGGLSIYGDMLNAVTGENRSNLAESLAGPTLGTFAKTGTLINEAYKEASGKGGNPSFHALKLANEFAMVDSMIWTRAAWNNYLMAELNEMASPGYMSRSRRAADKNYGTEYFAGMGTGLRAPNIANIYEQ